MLIILMHRDRQVDVFVHDAGLRARLQYFEELMTVMLSTLLQTQGQGIVVNLGRVLLLALLDLSRWRELGLTLAEIGE